MWKFKLSKHVKFEKNNFENIRKWSYIYEEVANCRTGVQFVYA